MTSKFTDKVEGYDLVIPGDATAMIAGPPHTAWRDAVLTHPHWSRGLIPLFSSTPLVPTYGTRVEISERAAEQLKPLSSNSE
jgi:hypothetical protein